MKSVLILVLLSYSLCILGGWKKRSIEENDMEIDQSFKLASSNYAKSNKADENDLIRLTVYSQVVNGINYKVTFIDSSAEVPTIQEYTAYKPAGAQNDIQFSITNHTEFDASKGLIPPNDSEFTDLEKKLYKFLKNTKEKLNFMSYVYPIENSETNFFVISADTEVGLHQYILCQDRESKEYYSFARLK